MKFVELNRCFAPIARNQESNPDIEGIGRIWGRRIAGWLEWSDLLPYRRVVLLAEASSGKTEEFRHQAGKLSGEGKAAFFIRLEELADAGVEDALDLTEAVTFESWRNGRDEGWFFLDAVDEARLNRKKFENALKRCQRDLDRALERARVFISCRITDWKGDDRRVIEQWLPVWETPAAVPVESDEDAALLAPIFEPREQTTRPPAKEPERKINELLVIRIIPLLADQQRALATASGMPDVEAFIAAINRHGLDIFAERPGDLLELAEYWKGNGRFGSLAEMTEYGITRKLRELEPDRSDNTVLSLQNAREGAERLAAALTLGKSLILRIPSQPFDPDLASGALDPSDILEHWTDAERNALMRRGIFAPSTYGRVRFHHRSTQEYLTAKWLERLLGTTCPRSEIWNLLFAECYDVATVVPSLRPVAAWLALWHSDFCDAIIRREPLVLLRHGDPGSLPLETKKRLLLTYAEKHAHGEIADDHLEHKSLWMFTDAGLADAIRRAWDANARTDFRIQLLRLIGEGGIVSCIDLARDAAFQEEADDYLRIAALQALNQCGDREGPDRAVRQLMGHPSRASARLATASANVLYPDSLTTDQLLTLIAESQSAGEFPVEGFPYIIDKLYESCPDATSRTELVSGLGELCLAPPFASDYQRVSKRFQNLAKRLSPIASRYLQTISDQTPLRPLVRLLMAIERAERTTHADDKPQLADAVQANTGLNRALFWADVEEVREHSKRESAPTRYWQLFFGGTPLWRLRPTDLSWLFEDMNERELVDDQRIALSAIVAVLRDNGQLDAELGRLREMVANRPQFQDDLDSYLAPPEKDEETLRLEHESEHIKEQQKEKRERAKASWVEFRRELQADPSCLYNPERLATWPGISDLLNLTRWLEHRSQMGRAEKAALQWRLLEEAFGYAVAEAYRDGMKAVWRVRKPERPKREASGATTVKWTTILSCAGVAMEAAGNPEWAGSLSDSEADLAMRHGCESEQGYPDWIDALVRTWPQVALPILRQTLTREWKAGQEGRSEFLYHYAHSAVPIEATIQALLFETMMGAEPSAPAVLDKGIGIVQRLNLSDHDCRRLTRLARGRLRRHTKAGNSEHVLRYLALLLLVDTDRAIEEDVASWLNTAENDERATRAERTFELLFGQRDLFAATTLDRASVAGLEALLRLVYQYIRPEDDIVRRGSYEPNERDRAQDARSAILSALLDRPGAEAHRAALRLSADPLFESWALRFRELARGKAEYDAEPPSWSIAEVLDLEYRHTAPVKRGEDLFRVVMAVLEDIRHGFLSDDASSRRVLASAGDEDAVQNWLAEQLRLRAQTRFHVHREAKVAGSKEPDIIVSSMAAPCEVAIEIKHANKGWTPRELERALRKQLVEDYLKPASRRHGLLVITLHSKRHWRHPETNRRMSFDDLLRHLNGVASELVTTAGSFEVQVVGIDASSS